MNLRKISKIALWGAVSILALVLLVTSSIWMHFINNQKNILMTSEHSFAVVSLIFIVISILTLFIAIFLSFKEKELLSKKSFVLLPISIMLFIFAFALVGTNQNDYWNDYKNNGSILGSNAAQVFIVNIVFVVILLVIIIPATIVYIKQEFNIKEEVI